MSTNHLYTSSFPKAYRIEEVDIISLYQKQNWTALNDVVVCRDHEGNVTARFGQNCWNLIPFARSRRKSSFNFEFLNNSFELQIELKILAYGWLLNKNSTKTKSQTYSTVYTRLSNIKTVYKHLQSSQANSLSVLSKSKKFKSFKDFLSTSGLVSCSLEKVFIAINHAIKLEPWLKSSFGFTEKIKSVALAKELNDKEQQQTLVIPERLSDAIYGKAIELINDAHSHRDLIADIEYKLQKNYLDGKEILDKKIKSGNRFVFTNINGDITDKHTYASRVNDHQPLPPKIILDEMKDIISGVEVNNLIDFKRYLGQLITACYIACGAFTGMRDSELDKLTPFSYYRDNFDGRDYHMLQSHTFKLGERKVTWVTAPIAGKAIELVATLTKRWRSEIYYPNSKFKNTLWCNQILRSKPPVLISNWNARLQRFCKQFNFIVTEQDYQECLESNPQSLASIRRTIKVGLPWHISTHQFRRTLAFYCIKHRLGTIVALKQQFKHLYLSMTEWYTNGGKLASLKDLKSDKNIQQALDNINAEITTNRIFKQWHSDEKLSGSHGKAIIKMRGDIPHIYSSWETIFNAVKRGQLTLHGTAHSYCKNGYQCEMEGVVMPQFCVDCQSESSVIDKDQARWWQKKHKSLVHYMELGEDISVTDRSHYITQIRAAEQVMADFDMPFIPFEPDLKVTNL
ncbi:hypothetical protein [Shewanella indica]|uniref:hypothetical protein n=1 Tax=Shewanella indica TaxID=768528 RepID=UPI00399A7DE2